MANVEASLTEVAQTALDEENQAAALVARSRIIGEDSAIEAAGVIGNALRGGAAGATSGLDAQNIAISRGAGAAARVRIAPTAGVAAPPAGYTPAETPAMSNGAWAGTRLSRTVGGNTETLVVYTDIDEPTRVQFYDFDRLATTPSRYADTAAPAHANPYGPGDALTALAIGGAAGQAFHKRRAGSEQVPAARAQ